MKKFLFVFLGLVLLLSSCDRKAFVKKLTGVWTLDRYLYSGMDYSTQKKDTSMTGYRLTLNENQTYLESWASFNYVPNFSVKYDTFYNPDNTINYIASDTTRFVDTVVAPYTSTGGWELINSEEDLQLRDGSSNDVRIYRILTLTGSSLNLRKGNEEIYLKSL